MVRRVTALPLPAGQKLAAGRRTTEIKKEKERFQIASRCSVFGFSGALDGTAYP
jgi:hypothetical protein